MDAVHLRFVGRHRAAGGSTGGLPQAHLPGGMGPAPLRRPAAAIASGHVGHRSWSGFRSDAPDHCSILPCCQDLLVRICRTRRRFPPGAKSRSRPRPAFGSGPHQGEAIERNRLHTPRCAGAKAGSPPARCAMRPDSGSAPARERLPAADGAASRRSSPLWKAKRCATSRPAGALVPRPGKRLRLVHLPPDSHRTSPAPTPPGHPLDRPCSPGDPKAPGRPAGRPGLRTASPAIFGQTARISGSARRCRAARGAGTPPVIRALHELPARPIGPWPIR